MYQVLHTEKCKVTSIKGIEIHNERKTNNEVYKSNTNENIDPSRTRLNKALVGDMNSNYYMLAKDRITEIRGGVSPLESVKNDEGKIIMQKLRKDAVWTCDTVISASPDFFKDNYAWNKDDTSKVDFEKMDKFFKDSVEFMQNKYGKKNVIGAIVHYDETTPHMHVQWTPIKDNKLSYKSLSSPHQLRALQTEFNEHLRSHGYELERGDVDSKKKHLNQQKEKLNIEIRENEKKLAELEQAKKEYETMKQGSFSHPNLDITKTKANEIQKQNEILRLENRELKERLWKAEEKIKTIEKANLSLNEKIEKYKPLERENLDYVDRQNAYNRYLKFRPNASKEMEKFENAHSSIKEFGKDMLDHKKAYIACDEKILNLDNAIARNSANRGTEKATIKDIENKSVELDKLKNTLEGSTNALSELKGKLFKGKEKKALEGQIEQAQKDIKQIEYYLGDKYKIKDFSDSGLKSSIQKHENNLMGLDYQTNLIQEDKKVLRIEKDSHLKEYKYMKVRSKSFQTEWQNIINRFDNEIDAFKHRNDLDINRLSKAEIGEFKERLKSEGLEHSKSIDFVNEQSKAIKKSISHNRDIDYGMEL